MTEALSRLRQQREALERERSALNDRLQRCDDALQEMDAALALRDRLLEQHDTEVGHALQYGRRAPDVNPALNLSEIDLRRKSGIARAAAKTREDVQEQLQAVNASLSQIVAAYEEQVWQSVPGAACGFFTIAENARRQYETQLAQIDGVIAYASSQSGGDPQHPAFACATLLKEMGDKLMSELGAGATRDFRSGPALLESVESGTAQMGDVSRWLPRAQPNGSDNFNRGPEAPGTPPDAGLPNPALTTSEAEKGIHASPASISDGTLPRYLIEANTPRPRVG